MLGLALWLELRTGQTGFSPQGPYNKPTATSLFPDLPGSAFSSPSLILYVKPQMNAPSETASPPAEEEYVCLS